MSKSWAAVTPMANEEGDFHPFVDAVQKALDENPNGKVFFVVDKVSKDRTLELCNELSKTDPRFVTIWAPENKNVVDAYLRGYKEALNSGAEYIIEMDAGMSHDPASIKEFLKYLQNGYQCVFGSRFIEGGSMGDSPKNRRTLSKTGTVLSNILLGTKLHDMTSGYQGFRRDVVKRFTDYPLKSKAHFYQTELRYLLRKYKCIEIPIQYKAPSPRVSKNAIRNSIDTLMYYCIRRYTFRAVSL